MHCLGDSWFQLPLKPTDLHAQLRGLFVGDAIFANPDEPQNRGPSATAGLTALDEKKSLMRWLVDESHPTETAYERIAREYWQPALLQVFEAF